MDDVFKENYKVHVFSILSRLDSDWSFQVDNLHELWNIAADMLTAPNSFWLSFTSACFQFELLFEEYDIEEVFDKARKEWKEELMILLADMILKWYDDDIPTTAKIATMEDGRIQVCITCSFECIVGV